MQQFFWACCNVVESRYLLEVHLHIVFFLGDVFEDEGVALECGHASR